MGGKSIHHHLLKISFNPFFINEHQMKHFHRFISVNVTFQVRPGAFKTTKQKEHYYETYCTSKNADFKRTCFS